MSKRLAICIPSKDQSWKSRFAISLQEMIFYTQSHGYQVSMENIVSSTLSGAREKLSEAALRWGADYMLFVDDDMAFPKETAIKLMSHEKDIIGLNAVKKNQANPQFIAMGLDGKTMNSNKSSGIEKASHVGTGILLASRAALEAVKMPRFEVKWDHDKGWYVGEDVNWCWKLRESGIDLWVDHDLSKLIGHCGDVVFTAHAVKEDKESA